ncbi:MAG: hypothetical protein HWD58_07440 [Bacteroidota bacterium]|nr:MAG: hypothetical protein HWD58_07440 [Bacteroidota bacterium]
MKFSGSEVRTINCGSNTPPLINPISNQVVQVGQSVCVPVTITDVDPDNLTVSATGGIIPPGTFTILSSGPVL